MSACSASDGETPTGAGIGDPAPEREGDAARAGAEDGAEPSDVELLLRIAADRDKSAFAMIFDRYGARIKNYMLRGGAGAELAEEAAQEAMLAVWRRAETFKPERASAPAWIFTIARNKRIDLIRRAARFEPNEAEAPELAPENEPAAEQIVAEQERDLAVRAALGALSDEQRQVVFLAFYEGCAHAEISERLGLPLGTVKSRLRLAFGKLRAALNADFADSLVDS